MRCTLSGLLVARRTASTMSGPNEMLGTNLPSMISMWIQSAPAASTACTSSARRPKSAARMDGAITSRFMRLLRLIENVALNGQSEAVLLVRGGDVTGLLLYVDGRVAHGNRHPGLPEHRDVVLHVSQHGNRRVRNTEAVREGIDESSLVKTRRRDVEIVGLRAGNRSLSMQHLAQGRFAFGELRKIGARSDDLRG